MPIDAQGLIKALGPDAGAGLATVHTTLCRREAGAFQRAAKSGDDLLVACTQESRLFLELNAQTEGAPGLAERPIRFVNIRETGGWSSGAKAQPASVMPKMAALIARRRAGGHRQLRLGRPRAGGWRCRPRDARRADAGRQARREPAAEPG